MPEFMVFGPVKILQKTYFVFFSSISWGLFTGTNGGNFLFFFFKYSKFTIGAGSKSEKYHFFTFSTGTKSQY